MSFWYDKKGKSYASKGTASWVKAYAEYLVASLKDSFSDRLNKHIAGTKEPHRAESVVYDDPISVKDIIGDNIFRLSSVESALQEKVDKEDGKGLSSCDFTPEEKEKLANLTEGGGGGGGTFDGLSLTNTTAYTPTEKYHPATKKYVDDLSATAIKKGDLLQTSNTASGTGAALYISKIDNALCSAHLRYTVTTPIYNSDGTFYGNGNASSLFDGNYETRALDVPAGKYSIITIDFGNGSDYHTAIYAYGKILFSFLQGKGPASVSCRMYSYNSSTTQSWVSLPTSKKNANIYIAENNGLAYYVTKLEIKVTAPATSNTLLAQVEQQFSRPTVGMQPFVGKYQPETLYYQLKAPSFKGNLVGTADMAKADSNGNTFADTYATKEYVNASVAEAGGGDMVRSIYDTDQNGVVDDAEKLGGQLPSYYASTEKLAEKAPISHSSGGTEFGVGDNQNYGHCKVVNHLSQEEHLDGLALSAHQGSVLNGKIAMLKEDYLTPPALTTVTPRGTKIGTEGWTGTGFFCTDTDVLYLTSTYNMPTGVAYHRYCLRPADLSSKNYLNWTPYFVSEDTEVEFFWSPVRGLYEGLVPVTEESAEDFLANHIVWKFHPPVQMRYGKLSNAINRYVKTEADGTETVTHTFRDKTYFRDFSGVLTYDDYLISAYWGGSSEDLKVILATLTPTELSFLFLAMDISGDGTYNAQDWMRCLAPVTSSQSLIIETIDNFTS